MEHHLQRHLYQVREKLDAKRVNELRPAHTDDFKCCFLFWTRHRVKTLHTGNF